MVHKVAHARLTPEGKEKAEAILKELGLSVSAAYEMFYRQVIAHNGLPFDVQIPNAETVQAMRETRKGKGKAYESVEALFEGCGS